MVDRRKKQMLKYHLQIYSRRQDIATTLYEMWAFAVRVCLGDDLLDRSHDGPSISLEVYQHLAIFMLR